jgi:ABC-type transport system substrate-binding protein
MAIDMELIKSTLFEDQIIVADSLLPNGPMKSPNLPDYSYNPEKAKALLAEANWDNERVLDTVFYYGDQLTSELKLPSTPPDAASLYSSARCVSLPSGSRCLVSKQLLRTPPRPLMPTTARK